MFTKSAKDMSWKEIADAHKRAYTTNDMITLAMLENQAVAFTKSEWPTANEENRKELSAIEKTARLGLRREFGKLVSQYAQKSEAEKAKVAEAQQKFKRCPKCGQIIKEEAHMCKSKNIVSWKNYNKAKNQLWEVHEEVEKTWTIATSSCPRCGNTDMNPDFGCEKCGYTIDSKEENPYDRAPTPPINPIGKAGAKPEAPLKPGLPVSRADESGHTGDNYQSKPIDEIVEGKRRKKEESETEKSESIKKN